MEINFQVEGRKATLTLSSSAPDNPRLLVACLSWDEAKPPYRSLAERDAITQVLADVARLLGVVPLLADCDASLPTCTGYVRERRTTIRSKGLNSAAGDPGSSGGATE